MKPMTMLAIVWMLLAIGLSGRARAADQPEVPPALAPWQGWVLHGAEQALCPPDGNATQTRLCLFPTALTLRLDEAGLGFVLRAHLFAPGAVALPSAEGTWPARLTVNGKVAPVVRQKGRPVVWLPTGSHVLEGRLDWDVAPQSLHLPPRVGLVSLTRNGVAEPVTIGPGGDVRLSPANAPRAVENREHVRVFRRIEDGVPLTVTTLFRLDVSGLARTITLAGAVPAGSLPLAVNAPVAATLTPDGALSLDAGPGRYEVTVVARYPGRVPSLGPATCPYGREIWSFTAAAAGRETRLEGAPSVDPKSADVPPGWQAYPAFLIEPGAKLTLRELGRGAPVGRDALMLSREMWLDFSGRGMTVRDTISGENRSAWTLSMLPPGELGRVSLDGRDQPIVLLGAHKLAGVGLRQSRFRLEAESRYPAVDVRLPATGFDREFDRIIAVVHLPPGWRLLGAEGPDAVRGALLSGWTLLDLFLVFILAVAAASLSGKPAGLALGLFLLLAWQEPGAPCHVWIGVLIGLALMRLTGRDGRLAGRGLPRSLAIAFFSVMLLGLAAQSVPFVITQLRHAVAPQIGPPLRVGPLRTMQTAPPPPAPALSPVMPSDSAPLDEVMAKRAPGRSRTKARQARGTSGGASPQQYGSSARLDFDPNALMQTGPGLPSWQWSRVSLSWKGPVTEGQTMRLYMLSPLVVSGLDVARVVLLALALWLCLGTRTIRGRIVGVTVAAGLCLWLVALPGPALAGDFPPSPLLDGLKTRLTEPPRCAPHCLGSAELAVSVDQGRLRIAATMDTAIRAALPLPVVSENWRPTTVLLDGAPATDLVRLEAGLRVLAEAGRHVVTLEGPVPTAVSFTIAPGLPPDHVRVTAPGYRVRGVDARGVLRGALECIRAETASPAAGARPGAQVTVPAFFAVERSLDFGLTWEVTTTVRRRSPAGDAVVASVPLLPGEMPDSPAVTVRDGRAMVSFAAGQQHITWRSKLPVVPTLTLTAPSGSDLVETWRVNAAPFYTVGFDGLPPAVRLTPAGRWQPRFLPWPGETLRVQVTRPPAAPGAVMTLQRTDITTRQGRETRDVTVSMTFRAAKGGRHAIGLPAGAEVTRLTVAGRETLPTGGPGEVGFSVPPGLTTVLVHFRERTPLGLVTSSPAVDLRMPAVNVTTRMVLAPDRWLLLTRGQTPLGPVVLFWGWLLAVVAVAMAMPALGPTPLSRRQWLLYALGLVQATPLNFVFAMGWLPALGWRSRHGIERRGLFNLLQIALIVLALLALTSLYDTLQTGLLGMPRVQVGGNGSTATNLVWTFDRVAGAVPLSTVVSVPLFVFRVLMLAWAVWLARALVRWVRWGVDALTEGGGWRAMRLHWRRPDRRRPEGQDDRPAGPEPRP